MSKRAMVQLTKVRFFGLVFRSTGLAEIVTDLNGLITHANPAAERLHGWGPGELVGHSVTELMAPGQAHVTHDQVLAANGTWVGTMQRRRRSGAVFPARLTVTAVHDDAGDPLGLVGIIDDDTPAQRWRTRFTGLVALGAALNAESDPAAVLARICRDACELFDVDGVYVSRLDEKTNELVTLAGDGLFAAEAPGIRVPIPDLTSPLARAVRERRPMIQHNVVAEGVYAERVERYHMRAAMLAPLVRGDRVLGVLTFIDSQHPKRFDREDAELARAFAELAAVALEDARLHQAERAKNERLLALAHVSQLLTSSLETDEVFDAIARGAQRLLAVDEVRIWLLESPQGPFRLAHIDPPANAHTPQQLDYRWARLGMVLQSGKPWQTSDLQAEPRTDERQYTEMRDLHGCLAVPLIAQGTPVGGLTIFTHERRTFDPEDVELAQAFAHQAALAVRNAETLARERQASRIERLMQRSRHLLRRDRALIQHLLAAAERIIDLGSASYQPTMIGKRLRSAGHDSAEAEDDTAAETNGYPFADSR